MEKPDKRPFYKRHLATSAAALGMTAALTLWNGINIKQRTNAYDNLLMAADTETKAPRYDVKGRIRKILKDGGIRDIDDHLAGNETLYREKDIKEEGNRNTQDVGSEEFHPTHFPQATSFLAALQNAKMFEQSKWFGESIYGPVIALQLEIGNFLEKNGCNSIVDYVKKYRKKGAKLPNSEKRILLDFYKKFSKINASFKEFADQISTILSKEDSEWLSENVFDELIWNVLEEIMRVLAENGETCIYTGSGCDAQEK